MPSTSTTSPTPWEASCKKRLSSIRARQGTETYLSGSPSRRAAMRAHANTESSPPSARVAEAVASKSSTSAGSMGTSASVGQTTVQAPQDTHASTSIFTLLSPTEIASAMHASMHLRHVEWRLRTATQRFSITRTDLPPSASATSAMSERFGILKSTAFRAFRPSWRKAILQTEAYPSITISSSACSSSGVFALMKQPPIGSASSTLLWGNS